MKSSRKWAQKNNIERHEKEKHKDDLEHLKDIEDVRHADLKKKNETKGILIHQKQNLKEKSKQHMDK